MGAKRIVAVLFGIAGVWLPVSAADPRAFSTTTASVVTLSSRKPTSRTFPPTPSCGKRRSRNCAPARCRLWAVRVPQRPTPRILITTLETALDRAAAAKPNPGRFILHRLNRTEYANAIRDLLSLDIDVSSLLPPDDESYGFDNIADVLGVSPALLEQYVNASRKIVRLATGDVTIGPVVETYRTRPDLSQDQQVEGLPLGTRGGLVARHNFPVDGDYTLKVVLARNSVEVTRGLEEPHQIEILIDGDRVFQATVGGKEDTELATKNPISSREKLEARLQIRTHIKAGPRNVGVTFVRKDNAEVDTLLQPFLRTTLDPVNEVGLPHVESLIVEGPYNASGSGDTPSRRRIFVCHPANAS